MTWVLIDDQFHTNRKIVRAGLAGAGLYVRSLSFIAAESTDGWIPREWAREVGTPTLVNKLVSVGLWKCVKPGEEILVEGNKRRRGGEVTIFVPGHGYYVPDYLHYNPSRREVQETRLLRSAAGRAGADGRWHGKTHSKSHGKHYGKTMPPTPNPLDKEQPQALVPRDVTSEVDAARIEELHNVVEGSFGRVT